MGSLQLCVKSTVWRVFENVISVQFGSFSRLETWKERFGEFPTQLHVLSGGLVGADTWPRGRAKCWWV